MFAGLRCLHGATDIDWVHDPSMTRYIPLALYRAQAALSRAVGQAERDAETAREKTAAVLRQISELRELNTAKEVEARTLLSCFRLLERDEIAALTNPVCQPRFVESGLSPSFD